MTPNHRCGGIRPPLSPTRSEASGAPKTNGACHTAKRKNAVLAVLKAGALYFAVVFGAGFLLGTIRVLWATPRFGARPAEMMELPGMLLVIIVAAQWIVRRFASTCGMVARLGMGLIGLGLMLVAEFMLIAQIRGVSIEDYMANRDPWAAAGYYLLLGVFAVLPMAVARTKRGS